MSMTANLSEYARAEIAKTIGEELLSLFDESTLRSERIELGESLEIWSTEDLPTISTGRAFLSNAGPSGEIHHQVLTNGRATHFAVSKPSASGVLRIEEIAEATLAGNIDEALEYAEAWLENDVEMVRLLQIPTHFVRALWFSFSRTDTPDMLVVVSSVADDDGPFGRAQPMRAERLLEMLSKAPLVGGVTFEE